MKIRIRKFRETDLQDVFHLFIEGFEEDPTFEKSPHIKSVEDFKGYFGQTVNKALGGFLIAESDGEVLCFTLSFPVRISNSEQEDLGRIQWVVVGRKYRRKGIGCRLVRESLKYFASKRLRLS